ncbi:type II toxin-antitoxin system Phd/YefM family antitoxin [Azospirillum halopraeferens]|uniref:type II toxin-antitoxin system Phd/YefM family antitoxin n=1 Tax=Azospirillum halopraeferens TaxID=34010 RepID=UPI000403BC5E|nr:type II toxin-antitoxin system Phd/YefM family antitoxin [Azospirillum halopraeferens]
MDTVNQDDAKIHRSQLVDRAAAGEEIIIARSGRPMARLVPLRRRTAPRPLGLLRGQVTPGDDFDAPLPAEMARAFRGELP